MSRSRMAIDHARQWTLVMLLLLIAVTLAVAEMAARSLKRQHQALAQKVAEVERLALVAEHTSNGVAISDAMQRVQWVNPAFVSMHGYTLDEIRGQTVDAVLKVERIQAVKRQRFSTDHGAEHNPDSEIRMTGKDGGAGWFEVDVQPVRDGAAQIVGWISLFTPHQRTGTAKAEDGHFARCLAGGRCRAVDVRQDSGCETGSLSRRSALTSSCQRCQSRWKPKSPDCALSGMT